MKIWPYTKFAHGWRRRAIVRIALALVMVSPPTVFARAQLSCDGSAAHCNRVADQYDILKSFQSLPNPSTGPNVFTRDLATVTDIYLNATVGQRNQAADNASGVFKAGDGEPQYNLWNQISSTSQILPTLGVFPQLQISRALADTLTERIYKRQSEPLYTAITGLLTGNDAQVDNYIGAVQEIDALKSSFDAYAAAFQGQSTQYANPQQVDPRPFQISATIANNPWLPAQASTTAIQIQQAEWGPGPEGLQTSGAYPSGHSLQGNTTALLYAMLVPEAYQSMMISAQQFGLSRNIMGVHHTLDVIGGRLLAYYTMTQLLAGTSNYTLTDVPNYDGVPAYTTFSEYLFGTGGLSDLLHDALGSKYTAVPYASCASNVAACMASGVFPSAAQFAAANQAYADLATYGLPAVGAADLPAVVPDNAELLLKSRFPYLSATQIRDVLATTELPSGGPLDDGSGWVRLNLFKAAGGYGAFNSDVSVTLDASKGGFNAVDMWSNDISGTGGLAKYGSGLLILGGNNTYSGGTFVKEGTLALSGSMVGDLTIDAGATFVSGGGYSVGAGFKLSNAGTFESVNSSLVNRGTIDNSGILRGGLLNYGTFNQTAGTFDNSSVLINDGIFNANLRNTGIVGGSGTIVGNVVNNGIVAPGNSIGTLTVNGAYTQAAGSSYQVETNAAGQADRIDVSGAPGTATLSGGTVTVTAAPGVYAPSTTYIILTATGGVTGAYASSNTFLPFLQSSLAYDANNVYLTLKPGGFAAGAGNGNQSAVGRVLDQSVAGSSGDFATVIGTMATYTQAQGQAAMAAMSGQNYSAFGTANLGSGVMFMNLLGQQIRLARGGSGSGNRVAVAEACDASRAEVCGGEPTSPWSLWGSAMGGTGSVAGNTDASSLSYNAGGFATGADYRFDPHFLAGFGVGYASGNQWLSGFSGQGTTNSYQASLYASFTQAGFYLDGLVGYGYNDNQMTRQIVLPNLAARIAQGRAGANQFLGQAEAGYRIDLYQPAAASITPFARFQGTTNSQAGFGEHGAGALGLNVAPQTTSSVRSVLGAELAGAFGAEGRGKLAMQLRAGWAHEYASTARPVTASFAGAPGSNFTVFGAAPQTDSAILSLSAATVVAPGVSLYARYDGELGTGTSTHALNGGLRVTW
jgi:autotransporter-associated beta strand protein